MIPGISEIFKEISGTRYFPKNTPNIPISQHIILMLVPVYFIRVPHFWYTCSIHVYFAAKYPTKTDGNHVAKVETILNGSDTFENRYSISGSARTRIKNSPNSSLIQADKNWIAGNKSIVNIKNGTYQQNTIVSLSNATLSRRKEEIVYPPPIYNIEYCTKHETGPISYHYFLYSINGNMYVADWMIPI